MVCSVYELSSKLAGSEGRTRPKSSAPVLRSLGEFYGQPPPFQVIWWKSSEEIAILRKLILTMNSQKEHWTSGVSSMTHDGSMYGRLMRSQN